MTDCYDSVVDFQPLKNSPEPGILNNDEKQPLQSDMEESDLHSSKLIFPDKFFHSLYNYYICGGWRPILSKFIIKCCKFIFISCLFVWVFICTDWNQFSYSINQLRISTECKSISFKSVSFFYWLIGIGMFFRYIFRELKRIWYMRHISTYVKDYLKYSDSEFHHETWNPLILKRVKEILPVIAPIKDPFVVTNRIMRCENYTIAMLTKLQFHEWMINKDSVYVLQYIWFDSQIDNNGRSDFSVSQMKLNLIKCVVYSTVMLPILFLYRFFLLLIKHTAFIKGRQKSTLQMRWNTLTEWKQREFNEMKHSWKQRMKLSAEYGQIFVERFRNPTYYHVLKFIVFVCSSFMFIMIIFMFVDTLFISEFTIFLTFVYTVVQSMMTSRRSAEASKLAYKYMTQFLHVTTPDTFEEKMKISNALWSTTLVLLQNCLVVLSMPFYLIFFIYPRLNEFKEFLVASTIHQDYIGDICQYSYFENKSMTDQILSDTVEDHELREPTFRYLLDKMQQSKIYFMNTYHESTQNDDYKSQMGQLSILPENLESSSFLADTMRRLNVNELNDSVIETK